MTIESDLPLAGDQVAEASFSEAFSRAIAVSCGGCHGPSHKLPLNPKNLTYARERILELVDCSADNLFEFFASSHGGGNVGNQLSKPAVQKWLADESSCTD